MSGDAPWQIRRLRHDDLPRFKPLRLRALRDHPEAFGSSLEEEQDSDLTHMIGSPPNVTLGGFVAGELVATAATVVSPKVKQRHRGLIGGVYVLPSHRRSGLARAMLDRLIADARDNGLIILMLSVSIGNEAARRLYEDAGFVRYALEPASLRIGSQVIDAELMALALA